MSIRKIKAVLKKQLKDTMRNKTTLLQFVMFPVLAAVMTYGIKIEGMPDNYFVQLFAIMYIGMAPLTAMAAVLAEEKETNTLRVLMMSGVKAGEYLIGVGSYIFIICMLGAAVFGITGHYQGSVLIRFLLLMAVGILLSILTGAVIGIICKNQMAATSLTVPVMLALSFLPMLSFFNDKIEKVSRLLYSQQLNNLIYSLEGSSVSGESILTIALNALLILALFLFSYKKCGLA